MIRFDYDDYSREFQSIIWGDLKVSANDFLVEFNCTEHSLWWEDNDEHHIDDETLRNFDWSEPESV